MPKSAIPVAMLLSQSNSKMRFDCFSGDASTCLGEGGLKDLNQASRKRLSGEKALKTLAAFLRHLLAQDRTFHEMDNFLCQAFRISLPADKAIDTIYHHLRNGANVGCDNRQARPHSL